MKAKNGIITIALTAIGILLSAIVILGILFRHELKSLSSLKELSPGVYTMTYDGDYGFDEFLETGAKSDKDIEAFVTRRLLKGIPVNIQVTDAGCTAFVAANETQDRKSVV